MKNETVEEIQSLGLNQFGDVTIFGSFVRNGGENYRDIDIYVDCDYCKISAIRGHLESSAFKVNFSRKEYILTMPTFPFPNSDDKESDKDDDKDGETSDDTNEKKDELHIIVCPSAEAKNEPFYKSMMAGSQIHMPRVA